MRARLRTVLARSALCLGLAGPGVVVRSGTGTAQSLYGATAIVTGEDLRSRPAGLRQALGRVLAKVAGDPALAADPRLAGVDVTPLLRGFLYVDRMGDIPRHDEQGSRDRPFDLVVAFDPAAVDRLLADWGRRAWPAPRPPLVADIQVTPRRGGGFRLQADTEDGERHRAALLAAADGLGLVVVLPARLKPVPAPAGAAVLSGTLRWSEEDAGWNGRWGLGADHWDTVGTSFDEAYRAGVGGAARRLSGN